MQGTSTLFFPLDPFFKIRKMTLEEFKIVISWANKEGWYISDDYAEAIYRADSSGFFIGEIKGELICSHIGFKYGEYYFLTLHIVKKEYRGIGYGKKIEQTTKSFYENAKVIVLDASGPGIEKYKKLGYKPYCQTLYCRKKAEGSYSKGLVDLKKLVFKDVLDYDLKVFGYPRDNLLKSILDGKHFVALGLVKGNKLRGYGLLRKCQNEIGYAISPVYADDKETAREIFNGLQSFIVGKDVYIEFYSSNPYTLEIKEEQGWETISLYTKMYRGDLPKTDDIKVYGGMLL